MLTVQVEYRRVDERGAFVQVSSQIWRQINVIKMKAGHLFGQHYHKKRWELFYVVSGTVKLTVYNQNFKDPDHRLYDVFVAAGKAFIIEPFDQHTLEAVDGQDAVVVEMLSKPYKEEEDTYKYE